MRYRLCVTPLLVLTIGAAVSAHEPSAHQHADDGHSLHFTIESVGDGKWSDSTTWKPARVPQSGDRVLVKRDTRIQYDVENDEVIRMLHIAGTVEFKRDCDTELNVGILKIQSGHRCNEDGFACDFRHVHKPGTPNARLPALIVGTPDDPIPAKHTARIRLHYLDGMKKDDAPAVACCTARMEIHGSPMSRTWIKLGADAKPNDDQVMISEEVTGWRIGDEIIVTASHRDKKLQTEERTIKAIEGRRITLNKPLEYEHFGTGQFRSEVANLSRNVIIESADPEGVRGHTVYHRFSRGGISYARFAHLGKKGVLGRYSIHYHLVGDTMRGSSVRGVSIVDSHNRWITIHGTQYLVVRDCIGYKSIGHGFFLEDGTEIYNLLDRNLGVQANRGRRLPKQVLPFDPNDGAAFWWANGRNTIVRNVTCENEEYGYRYDMQHSRYFDSKLPILQPDGTEKVIDVRTLPISRFEDNEAHTERFYGMVVAANGNSQPDNAIRDDKMFQRIKSIDWTGPDIQHPHKIRNLTIWGSHYAMRPHSPSMLMENIRIHKAAYGIYRPAFENHEYRNLHISAVGAEPFNRGMDDASAQTGKITVDGLTFETGYGNNSTPLVQISDVNISGDAETHFRNVTVNRPPQFKDRWPLINRGVGPRVPPLTKGVPIYLHDYFGDGRDAKVVSTAAKDLLNDGNNYQQSPPLTGDESRVTEVRDVEWPKLLDPIDDVPPATIITSVIRKADKVIVQGVSHDDGNIVSIKLNNVEARVVSRGAGVVNWESTIDVGAQDTVVAFAKDKAGNVEQTAHTVTLDGTPIPIQLGSR